MFEIQNRELRNNSEKRHVADSASLKTILAVIAIAFSASITASPANALPPKEKQGEIKATEEVEKGLDPEAAASEFGKRHGERLKKLERELDLTPEQKKKMQQSLVKMRDQVPCDKLEKDEKRKCIREKMAALREEMQPGLSPEQRSKLDEFRSQRGRAMIDRLEKELDLTAEQKEKLLEAQSALDSCREITKPDEITACRKEKRSNWQRTLDQVLTPEQQAEFKEMNPMGPKGPMGPNHRMPPQGAPSRPVAE